MSEALKNLANALHIDTKYSFFADGRNQEHEADDELLKFLIEDMGYKAGNEEEIAKSLQRIAKKRWQKALESIYVCQTGNIKFDLVLDSKESAKGITFYIAKEGQKKFLKIGVEVLSYENYQEGRNNLCKLICAIKEDLEPNYYELKVKTEHNEYKTVIAVAPKRCYEIDKKGKEKFFGFAIQLYSLRSKKNWGVGDFGDLLQLVDLTAQNGGDVIGLNPLSVLWHDYPENASPYASISRLFLNPIYIDVEAVPFYDKKDKDDEVIAKAKQREIIDYTAVYNAKINALQAIFKRMKKQKKSAYFTQFEAYKKAGGQELMQLATFQEICHQRYLKGGSLPAVEEKALSSSLGSGVNKFVAAHKEGIEFFQFLQFEADRQLKAVEKRIKQKGMAIGLYRDMPVGVSKNSAEVWSDRYLYIQKSGAGAPPDSYFPTGQKWGLAAFNPFELKERAYKPYIKILRANMRFAGAVRIDHIMGLSRLFIIPDKGNSGTYMRYFSDEMINILILESYLNRCVVVGECIGNVEEGYAQSLLDRGIYLLGVLWSERKDADGTMKKPDEYEEKYFASVGTHDMPPLKAWWYGREIATMQKLGLYNNKETESAYHWREHERRLVLNILDEEHVWPEDKYRCGDYLYGEGYPEGIEEAVHAFMAKSKSEVFMLMPEDIFQSEKIQNLPGTDIDKYPNWRSKQIIDLEDMGENEAFRRHINIVKRWR